MSFLSNIFLSSTGEGLAKRWESFFVGIIPVIVVLSSALHWGVAEADLTQLNGQIVMLISSLVAAWQSAEHIAGWVRRFIYKKEKIGKFSEI